MNLNRLFIRQHNQFLRSKDLILYINIYERTYENLTATELLQGILHNTGYFTNFRFEHQFFHVFGFSGHFVPKFIFAPLKANLRRTCKANLGLSGVATQAAAPSYPAPPPLVWYNSVIFYLEEIFRIFSKLSIGKLYSSISLFATINSCTIY